MQILTVICYHVFNFNVTILIRISRHTPRQSNQESTASDDLRPIFSVQWTFLSNNDSDWHHHWCRFCNGHSATCLVRIQNYREWGPPFSSNSQRHSGACALSFCRCILSVRLPLNYVSTVTFFTPSLLQCYQSCHTPLKYVFSPTCETQVFCWTYLSFYSTTW